MPADLRVPWFLKDGYDICKDGDSCDINRYPAYTNRHFHLKEEEEDEDDAISD